MSGGAWIPYVAADGTTTRWYRYTKPATIFSLPNKRGSGCIAIKRELEYLGYSAAGFKTGTPAIGDVADSLIRAFQGDVGLVADGIVGPATAELLFKRRIVAAELSRHVPDRWAAKLVKLESAEDPGADGYTDADDHGLAQINVRARPVTVDQAYDPSFSIPYLVNGIADAHVSLGDWEGAVASWNVGYYWAEKWVAAGKASTGAWDPKNSLDWFTRASNYVALVAGQTLRS